MTNFKCCVRGGGVLSRCENKKQNKFNYWTVVEQLLSRNLCLEYRFQVRKMSVKIKKSKKSSKNSTTTKDTNVVNQPPHTSVSIEDIRPTVKELLRINISVSCTEEDCDKVFTSISNLNMHLYRTHMKPISQFESIIRHYHCPEDECPYYEYMHFKNMKLLRQHYQKVHLPKSFICEKCQAGFSTKVYKNMHIDYCGAKFQCSDCPISYPSYESLLTHGRRKKHRIKEKHHFRQTKIIEKIIHKEPEIKTVIKVRRPTNSPRVLLPKPTANVHLVIIAPKVSDVKDQSIQTDPIPPEPKKTKLNTKPKQLNKKSIKILKDTRQTQTSIEKIVNSTETQTHEPHPRLRELLMRIKEPKNQFPIQTPHIKQECSNEMVTENTLQFINIKQEFTDNLINEDTQETNLSSDDMLCSSVTNHYTDSSDLNLQNFDSNLFNCNMETQTDFNMSESEDIFNYCDIYNNMYTQTCDDLFLDALELNNIETQTADEILTSVGSQTVTSFNKGTQSNTYDTNHVETQTDLEFQKILESMAY